MLYRISRLAIRDHKSDFNDQQLLHWAVTLWEPLTWVALYFTHIIELFDLYLFCWLFCLFPTSDACVWCWACTSSHPHPMYLLTEDGTHTLPVWACELPWGCSPGSGFCCLDTQLMVRPRLFELVLELSGDELFPAECRWCSQWPCIGVWTAWALMRLLLHLEKHIT